METSKLKKFAQSTRRMLIEQVSAKLALVLSKESAARRESAESVRKLEEAIHTLGKDQVIERVAYIWFNRFCALRFMDVNRYTRIAVVSPAEGQSQPEILADAKMGHIEDELFGKDSASLSKRQHVFDLLNGKSPSSNPQGEAYSLLLVAVCNSWHRSMPFLFQRIDDYTELLLPKDLLSEKSILHYTREALTPEACQDIEVIGWLYQFYIAEKKDEVFAALKKGKKITPENIPAATQLFTPHWIVRYLVENSLGRLWMLNRPASKLVDQMDYYIKPEEPEADFLKITKLEEIKICDPACGSGHMLTYAFDLLYAIYEEEGYESAEIPEKILTYNLYGIEIDERAGELAAFALTMKARAKQRRFFNKGVEPNICVLENIELKGEELNQYMDFVGRDLFTAPLQATLRQFEEADNFGSLIRPEVTDVESMQEILETKNVSGELFLSMTHQKMLKALRQADYLSPKYHVVVANPPYMGIRKMNEHLKTFVSAELEAGKHDLYAAMAIRNLELCLPFGTVAMITMHSWMFLSSFVQFRNTVADSSSVLNLIHLGPGAFDSISGEVVQTAAFCFVKAHDLTRPAVYIDARTGIGEEEKSQIVRLAKDKFAVALSDFLQIDGMPFAYWLTESVRTLFDSAEKIADVAKPRQGLATSDNDRFLRLWSEVAQNRSSFSCGSREEAAESKAMWFPITKGGTFRKWFGNNELVANWENDGGELLAYAAGKYGSPTRTIKNIDFYFREGITWSTIANEFSMRFTPQGGLFETKGAMCFCKDHSKLLYLLGFSNTPLVEAFLKVFSPTLDFHEGPFGKLPIRFCHQSEVVEIVIKCIEISKCDFDSRELSVEFRRNILLLEKPQESELGLIYAVWRSSSAKLTEQLRQLEEQNNRLFANCYELEEQIDITRQQQDLTLSCNPSYRYGSDNSGSELEALLLADTMREFISYAVGCMFGRYSLDEPGLILANQGETADDYRQQIPEPTLAPDEDNVIPLLDGDWFTDDISERFKEFLKVTFGTEHYEENLTFLENALYPDNLTGKKRKTIRDYFLKEFYNHHVKLYKKRPIYWLFSSPKGSFNALIYMHRYRPDTVSIVLNDYLREFRTKLNARKNHLEAVSISASSTQSEKTKSLKEIEKVSKMIAEVEEYEREILYPLATKQIGIDLDDGVKVNYPKFGAALKSIPGLTAKG